MSKAFVALGSNVGDRRAHLDQALIAIGELGSVVDGSPIYETNPVGGPDGQHPYLNAVVALETSLHPSELLKSLIAIEAERGRTRDTRWGPRTLDCDILWYDGETVDEPGLTIPHPEMRNRAFVLVPLTDIDPGVSDADGTYADALAGLDDDGLKRVTGPVLVDELRWLEGLADATTLQGDGPYEITLSKDWSNSNGDAFGALLAGIALRAAGRSMPGGEVSQLNYRYIEPVPAGETIEVRVHEDRRSRSSIDLKVTLHHDGRIAGDCNLGLLARPKNPVTGPPAAEVMPRSQAHAGDQLAIRAGGKPGNSARSWTAFERWDVPDLVDASEPVLRAWTPNVTRGWKDPYLTAASIFMPIDALIWPATLQAMGYLPDSTPLTTPTIEISARFASVVDEPWYLAEASIDHFAGRTVAGTIRVWGQSGSYAAVGHSLNLAIPVSQRPAVS
ncbi:MAG: 2-amino-4-hydroxy-6-hydroxymethyldihydropteridine diphosphokinase [Acidimicrobiia bacterium]